MRRSRIFSAPAILAGALLLVWSCVDGDAPLGPEGFGGLVVSLPIQATLIPSPADGSARPVNRVRAVAERVPDGQVLASTVVDVSPDAESWEIGLEIPITAPGIQVTVLLQLIHVDASGGESVEFSGRTAPILLVASGQSQQPVAVEVIRGPTDNLTVTSVTISGAPGALTEGDSATLSASVTTAGPGTTPIVYWSLLDPERATLAGTTVRALLPGTVRVVATAGTHADTATIAVTQRPASVALGPDTITVVGLGSEGTFSASVLDARGDAIDGAGVEWRALDPAVAQLVSSGIFRAVAVGSARVQARASADTTLSARAVFRVDAIVADLAASMSASRASAEVGDTVVFTVTVANRSGASVGPVTATHDLPEGLELLESSTLTGVFAGGTWSIGTLAPGASAALQLTTTRSGGANGATLLNVVTVDVPAGYADPDAANNRATAGVVGTQLPHALVVSPDTLSLLGLGQEGAFSARVVDRRGEPVADATVAWSSLAPGIAESRDGGVFRSVALGTATVEALVVGAPSVRDEAVVVVRPVRSDLAVTKVAGRTLVESDDTVTFTVTVTNQGSAAVDGVQVADGLPAGLTLVEATPGTGSFSGDIWSVGSLGAGASASLRMLTRTPSGLGGQTLTNTASVTLPGGYEDTNPGNDAASASVQVPLRETDLSITKTVSEPVVAAGHDAVFSVTVTNPGRYGLDYVRVADMLPVGLTHGTSSASSGSWDPGTGFWDFNLPAGSSATLTISATATPDAAGSTLVNTATIIEAPGVVDPEAGNNQAQAQVEVMHAGSTADVQVAKHVDVTDPTIGAVVTFTLVVRNVGPDTATGIMLLDTLPTGLDSLEVFLPQGATAAGRGLIQLDTLVPGDSALIQMTAMVEQGTVGTTLSNVVRVVTSDQADPDTLNNKATASVSVAAPPSNVDIDVLKLVDPEIVRETESVVFTVRVANLGTTDATGLVVRDSLAPGFSLASASATVGTYSGTTWLWTVGTLAAGDTAVLTLDAVVVDGTGGSTQVNAASLASLDQVDVLSENDVSDRRVTVQKRTLDLSVTKSIDAASPAEGTKVAYTVTLRNHGPGSASTIQVYDSLPLLMALDSTRATAGTVDAGGGQWTLPSLAAGDSAKLMTYHTVGLGAAGTVLTNRVRITSLAQSDTVASNDTASVAVAVPTSTPPTVVLSSPGDGANFDPGDTITFTATAEDFEDGDLTASIVWTSSKNGTIGTGGSFATHTLSAGPHVIVARVTDLSGTTSADTVDIILAIVGAPATLNVPFGGTASLPISLSAPAPAGGLVLTVTSSAPGVAQPTSATVTIPAGALSANATIQGVLPGAATVTVASVGYGSATTQVSVTAALNITQSNVTFPQTLTSDITVRLESSGTVIAAPAGGLSVTLTPINPFCAAAPATVTIPAGQTQTAATLSYGGEATTPCTTYVKATATSVVPDSVRVTVNPPPGITTYGYSYGVGSGLQQSASVALGAVAPAGGVTVRVESANAEALLIAPDASTPGSAFVDFTVPAGSSSFTYYAQGLEGITTDPSVTVTASAPGYINGSTAWTVKQPVLYIADLGPSPTTLGADDPFTVRIGVPYSTSAAVQPIRAGGTAVTATVTSATPATGTLVSGAGNGETATVVIPVGSSNSPTTVLAGGVAFDPVAAGTTDVSATIPGFIAAPLATRTVTVSAPTITVYGYSYGVGSGLQQSSSVALGAVAPAGGVTVRVESSNAEALLIAPDASTPGSAFVDFTVPAGSSSFTYYAQGLEGITTDPSVTVTASAPAYTDGSTPWTVKQPVLYVSDLGVSPTTLSADDPFTVRIGVPYSTSAAVQSVRAGGTAVIATVTTSTPATGTLVSGAGNGETATVVIPVGSSNSPTTVLAGGVAFDPVAAGTTNVSATIPGFLAAPLATRTVTVSAPTIAVYGYSYGLGSGLQQSASVVLGAVAPAGGVTVRVASSNAAALLIAPDASTPGSAFVDFTVPAGSSSFTYYAQGLEGITTDLPVTVTASAPAYTDGSAAWTVKQPVLFVSDLGVSPTTFSADDPFTVRIGVPYSTSAAVQPIRAGGTGVTATVSSSVPSVGQFATALGSTGVATVVIPVGASSSPATVQAGGVAFDALTAGTTDISATIPGFLAAPLATRTVTVSAPGITMYSGTVGAGLQTNPSVSLGAAGHGGVTLRIQSSAPGIVLVSPNASTPGTAYIDIPVADGTQWLSYYVQGVEGTTGTATVTASAQGFTDGSGTWTVESAKLAISGLVLTTTAGAADDAFDVRVGIAYGNGVSVQTVRAGGSDLTATVTSSTPASGQLKAGAQVGASVTVTIPVGAYNSPTVANGGLAFDPVAAGTTTVAAIIPGFVAQPDATRVVTINP